MDKKIKSDQTIHAERKVLDLVIKEGEPSIDASLGMPDEVAHEIREKFMKWLAFEKHTSYTNALVDFLESDVFKKIGWTPKTPTDYLALGYCFSGGKFKYQDKMSSRAGRDLRPCDLLDLLLK